MTQGSDEFEELTLAQRVATERKKRGFRQADLAKQAGVSESLISGIERATETGMRPTPATLKLLAEGLQSLGSRVSYETLLADRNRGLGLEVQLAKRRDVLFFSGLDAFQDWLTGQPAATDEVCVDCLLYSADQFDSALVRYADLHGCILRLLFCRPAFMTDKTTALRHAELLFGLAREWLPDPWQSMERRRRRYRSETTKPSVRLYCGPPSLVGIRAPGIAVGAGWFIDRPNLLAASHGYPTEGVIGSRIDREHDAQFSPSLSKGEPDVSPFSGSAYLDDLFCNTFQSLWHSCKTVELAKYVQTCGWTFDTFFPEHDRIAAAMFEVTFDELSEELHVTDRPAEQWAIDAFNSGSYTVARQLETLPGRPFFIRVAENQGRSGWYAVQWHQTIFDLPDFQAAPNRVATKDEAS